MTTLGFYRRVIDETGQTDREAVKRGTAEARFLTIGVFAALKEQLSGAEADDVPAQLPRDLKDVGEDA